MNSKQGIITSMWINNDGKSIGIAVVIQEVMHYSVHQVKLPYSARENYKLGDTVLVDTSSNTLIYQ